MQYFSFFGVLIGSFLFCAFPPHIFAGLILNADLRIAYEDNIVGLLSDQRVQTGGGGGGYSSRGMVRSGSMQAGGMGGQGSGKDRYIGSSSGSSQSPGDFSTTVSAQAGGYGEVGRNWSIFAKGFAEHTSYNTYTDLDATIGGITIGMITRFTNSLSAGASVFSKVKHFGDSERDADAFGGALSLKKKLSPSLWLRGFGEYEKNVADSVYFSYIGTRIGAGVGYSLAVNTLITPGYSYLVQKYDEPLGAEMKTHTAFLSAEWSLTKNWAVGGEYDFQLSEENVTGTNTTNNIFSLALRYSY